MMGRLEQDQGQLFYSFCLEEVVPDDHQVRAIASVLDLSWVAAIEASKSGQDLRTFCPQCEREFNGTSTPVTIKRGQQRQNSRSLGCITRHVADNRTRSIHG